MMVSSTTAVHITEWLQPETVPEKISFGQINVPPAPKKAEVIISVKQLQYKVMMLR